MKSCASLPLILSLFLISGFALWASAGHYSYLLFSVSCMFWSLAAADLQPYSLMATSDAFTLAITSILLIIIYNQTECHELCDF